MSDGQYKPKHLQLRGIPEDVYKIIQKEQARLREKCNCMKSLETTVYTLIRKLAESEPAQ